MLLPKAKTVRDAAVGKSRTEIEAIIKEWVLGDENVEIMKQSIIRRFGYEKIAENIGLSPKKVQRAMNVWAEIVYKHL